MTTEEWFERATFYFGGTMTPEEIQFFEKETNADEELSQLMQLWKNTDNEAALYENNKEAAAALIATHNRLKPHFVNSEQAILPDNTRRKTTPLKNLRFSTWQWMAVAATIIGIIFLADLFLPKNNSLLTQQNAKTNTDSNKKIKDSSVAKVQQDMNQSSEKKISSETLYAQAFTPDEQPENYNGLLDNAFFYYNSAQYKKAIDAIENVDKATMTRGSNASAQLTNFYSLYYKAISLMALDSIAAAIQPLQQCLPQSPTETFKAKAQWYLALAYLKQENYSLSENILEQLISNPSSGAYKSKAENLLTAIKK